MAEGSEATHGAAGTRNVGGGAGVFFLFCFAGELMYSHKVRVVYLVYGKRNEV